MIEIYLPRLKPGEYRRARYVFETLFSTLGLPWRLVDRVAIEAAGLSSRARFIVAYGDQIGADLRAHVAAGGGVVHILRDSTLSPDPSPGQGEGGRGFALSGNQPPQGEGGRGFALSGNQPLRATVAEIPSGFLATVGFDLIAATWRCLSGLEGEAGMLREEGSPGNAHDKSNGPDPAQTPWVNQYLELLFDTIRQGFSRLGLPLIQKWYWPGGKQFAASLSHDVDRIRRRRELFLLASHLLRSLRLLARLRFGQAMPRLGLVAHLLIGREDPPANFQRLVELERVHGFRSAFYFLGGPRWWRRYGARYNWQAAEPRRIMNSIAGQGWEVGLHGSYYAYEVENGLRQEKGVLEALAGRPVGGHRQHYLHMHVPDAWRVQEAAGLVYDTTYGYRAKAGFKAGICFPFFPYDMGTERPVQVLELPLIFMDSNYSQSLSEQGWELIQPFLQTVKQHAGLITFNFHSCCVDSLVFPGWLELYGRLLDYLQEQEAFVAPGAEIAAWWEQRNCLEFRRAEQSASGTKWTLRAGKPIQDVYLKIYGCPSRSALSVIGPVDYRIIGQGQTWGIEIKELAPGMIVGLQVSATSGQETGEDVKVQAIR